MPLKVVVVGVGQMGRSHAQAYHKNSEFEIIGLVNRSPVSLSDDLDGYPLVSSFREALTLGPDVVSINTRPESHAEHAIAAMKAGAHVFLEKPIATTVEEARQVTDAAQRYDRKLVIGYILRYHPSWIRFIQEARKLGPPFVMRMNLNQQSTNEAWNIHKRLLNHVSPVVDCGVHYLDVMLQITDSRPLQVRGMGVRMSDEIPEDQVNYAHLQVIFEDGSVGWYEAGWGPMISDTAHFVKDVMGPGGAVSIMGDEISESADIDGHTKTNRIRIHRTGRGDDEIYSMDKEPNHQDLCDLEQQALLDAIHDNRDLSRHWQDAIRSLQIVLAADRSMREKCAIDL